MANIWFGVIFWNVEFSWR